MEISITEKNQIVVMFTQKEFCRALEPRDSQKDQYSICIRTLNIDENLDPKEELEFTKEIRRYAFRSNFESYGKSKAGNIVYFHCERLLSPPFIIKEIRWDEEGKEINSRGVRPNTTVYNPMDFEYIGSKSVYDGAFQNELYHIDNWRNDNTELNFQPNSTSYISHQDVIDNAIYYNIIQEKFDYAYAKRV